MRLPYVLLIAILLPIEVFAQHELGVTYLFQRENRFEKQSTPTIQNRYQHDCFGLAYQRESNYLLYQAGLRYFQKKNIDVGFYQSGGTTSSGFKSTSASAKIDYAYFGVHSAWLFRLFRTKKNAFQLFLGPEIQLDFKSHEREYEHYLRKKTTYAAWGVNETYIEESWEPFNAQDLVPVYGLFTLKIVPRYVVGSLVFQAQFSCGYTSENTRHLPMGQDKEHYQQRPGRHYQIGVGLAYRF